MKNKTRFIPGFLLGMFAMLVVVAGIGVGIYFSDMGITLLMKLRRPVRQRRN